MKELYLGLAICAFIVLVLTISVEVSTTGSYLNKKINKNNSLTNRTTQSNIKKNSLRNNLPERVYNKNNLNKLFLEKYYKRNNYNPKNNFYLPN